MDREVMNNSQAGLIAWELNLIQVRERVRLARFGPDALALITRSKVGTESSNGPVTRIIKPCGALFQPIFPTWRSFMATISEIASEPLYHARA